MTVVRTYPITLVQGAGWDRQCRIHAGDVAETAISIVGATIQFIAESAAKVTLLDLAVGTGITVTDAPGGIFVIALTGAQTTALTPGRYAYELWVTLNGQEPKRWLAGSLVVENSVKVAG